MLSDTLKFNIPNFECELKQGGDGGEVSCKGEMTIWCPPPMTDFQTPLGEIKTDIVKRGDNCTLKGFSMSVGIMGSEELVEGLTKFTDALKV